jgi:acyl carrier protein
VNAKVREIVSDVFGLPADRIQDTTGPGEVDQWDSLNHFRLVTAIEEEFRISLTMEEVQGVGSVAALEKLVAEKTGGS